MLHVTQNLVYSEEKLFAKKKYKLMKKRNYTVYRISERLNANDTTEI